MRGKNPVLACVLLLALTVVAHEAAASSGNRVALLEWEPRTEVLEYRSCGAADACWIAEVRNKRTKRLVAKLRCDSEQLFAKVGKRPETLVAPDCRKFETESKFTEIPSALRVLLER
ncbi:hypothetical protein [Cupriavidus sp. 2SB]|uniref:hypothetical protein n=1 Tax=Cupriavidus sp. 2SB TaxID=2502199 RepID=UPI0010F57F8C|nr:hypothetical protein [Cupriavidus sp. 2SB]